MVESIRIRVESAWFQVLKLKHDKLVSSFAFNIQLAPAADYRRVWGLAHSEERDYPGSCYVVRSTQCECCRGRGIRVSRRREFLH